MFFTVSYVVYNGRPIVKSWDMLDNILVIDKGVALFFKVYFFFFAVLFTNIVKSTPY